VTSNIEWMAKIEILSRHNNLLLERG